MMTNTKFLEFKNTIIDALSEIPESNAKKCIVNCFGTYESELMQAKEKSDRINLSEFFLSISQYAKISHITRQGVLKAIKEDRLSAHRIGSFWLISKEAKIVKKNR